MKPVKQPTLLNNQSTTRAEVPVDLPVTDVQSQQITGVLNDLTVQNAEVITGGSTIRVHYDTGFGNSIRIRGSEAPAN